MSDYSKALEQFIKPESMDQLLAEITPAVYDSLREAIAIGRWGDGSRLSQEQLELCMQAVILYETEHLPENERTGALLTSCPSAKSRH